MRRPGPEDTTMPELRIFASLTLEDPFTEIIPSFQAAHPGVTVAPTFGACTSLIQSMEAGAVADIYSSSSVKLMELAKQKGLIAAGPVQKLARLPLALVVGARDHSVQQLPDLLRPEIQAIAIGDPETVPPGRCARLALTEANLWDPLLPKLQVQKDAYQPLLRVAEGKAQAAFVFGTTAANGAGQVRVALDVPLSLNMDYPIALTAQCRFPRAAGQWMAFLQTETARAALVDAGFAVD